MRQRTPILARDASELRAARRAALAASGHDPAWSARPDGGQVGVAVAMTMGALHQGHVALLRAARARAAVVVATIFVNPLQFGPTEDLARYPRALDADLALCAAEGVDVVYVPRVEEIYPNGEPLVRVSAGPVGELLEGAFRPGFFDGVLTVVAKLLHMTAPDLAVFGAKDAQQVALVRRMVADLDFDVTIETVPTVREADGLACSSRNRYLSEADRRSALELYAALRAGEAAADGGATAVLAAADQVLSAARAASPPVHADYLALVDPATFRPVPPEHRGPAVLAVAARVGDTRLIDNLTIRLPAAVGVDRHGPRPGV
jgi:pantoate--beta-alanine ligase